MIAIKDAEWEVSLQKFAKNYYWVSFPKPHIGLKKGLTSRLDFESKRGALKNWKQFAELNGITKWEVASE